jgi:hypothetical protein
MPFKFSFHDQLDSLFYLSNGPIEQITNIFYGYDLGEWETLDKSYAKDKKFLLLNNLPESFDLLHHLLLGLEGFFILNSNKIYANFDADRYKAALFWFAFKFNHFKNLDRYPFIEDTYLLKEINNFKTSLISKENLDIKEIFAEICNFIALIDKNKSVLYYNYFINL